MAAVYLAFNGTAWSVCKCKVIDIVYHAVLQCAMQMCQEALQMSLIYDAFTCESVRVMVQGSVMWRARTPWLPGMQDPEDR